MHESACCVALFACCERCRVCMVCKSFVLQSASGRPSLVYKGRFPDPRLRDEDPGVLCSPPLR